MPVVINEMEVPSAPPPQASAANASASASAGSDMRKLEKTMQAEARRKQRLMAY